MEQGTRMMRVLWVFLENPHRPATTFAQWNADDTDYADIDGFFIDCNPNAGV
jgi:hypothetical protein